MAANAMFDEQWSNGSLEMFRVIKRGSVRAVNCVVVVCVVVIGGLRASGCGSECERKSEPEPEYRYRCVRARRSSSYCRVKGRECNPGREERHHALRVGMGGFSWSVMRDNLGLAYSILLMESPVMLGIFRCLCGG